MRSRKPREPLLGAVPFREALRIWAKIGLINFGGPAGQIALMHRILVEEKRWISETRFLHALNYCMLLPGPEAQQLAIYVGWLLHGTRGGLVAGVFFVLPGSLVILTLSLLYAGFHELLLVQAVFFGIKAAIFAIVVEAVIRIGKRALKSMYMYMIAAAAFVGIFVFDVNFPIIVLAAGLFGLLAARFRLAGFAGAQAPLAPAADTAYAIDAALADRRAGHIRPSMRRVLGVLSIGLPLWFAPLGALVLLLGLDHVFVREGFFFSKMAVVTFGGAYAVLAYVAQEAVNHFSWLTPGEMLDGLGMAETTPGPLIMVLQFVGFMGGYRNPGGLDPMLSGTLASLVTVWVTFVPCFLWIFLGAPYVEALRGHRALNGMLSAITAAVVGVILNLAAWFALHVFFHEVGEARGFGARLPVPAWGTLEPVAVALGAAALLAMLRFKIGLIPTLLGCAVLGAAYMVLA